MVVDGANAGAKLETNEIRKQHFVEPKHHSFLLCVFSIDNFVLVLCCCFSDGKNAQICILVR